MNASCKVFRRNLSHKGQDQLRVMVFVFSLLGWPAKNFWYALNFVMDVLIENKNSDVYYNYAVLKLLVFSYKPTRGLTAGNVLR